MSRTVRRTKHKKHNKSGHRHFDMDGVIIHIVVNFHMNKIV
jgi:hypothetical protein